MHQDQRIGLALGVLLIGSCAAFFFRNETRTVHKTPRLQHAQQLDDRIAEKATRPYLKGVEAIEAADRQRSQSPTEPSRSFWSLFNSRSAISSNSPVQRDRKPSSKSIGSPDDVMEMAPITVSVDDQPTRDVADTAHTESPNSPLDQAMDHGQTYVVQKGETLTSIATRTLGNPSRYHELFEANSDQLDNPDDVKPGMVLRIPAAQTAASAKPRFVRSRATPEIVAPVPERNTAVPDISFEAAPAQPETEPPARNYGSPSTTPFLNPPGHASDIDRQPDQSTSDEPATPRRFVPVPRTPFSGRPDSEASSRSKRGSNGRRLTQVQADPVPTRIAR